MPLLRRPHDHRRELRTRRRTSRPTLAASRGRDRNALLGIDQPIILAGMGAGATLAEFAAAISNQGGLGSVGSLFRSTDAVKRDIDKLPTLTNRNFAINHIPQALDADAFRHTLQARPAVISFALDDPGDLIRQAHDVGSLVMVQVTTVGQAIQAA